MYLPIVALLNNTDLAQISALLAAGDFMSGKLTATGAAGSQLFKLNKGDAIVYPTTRLHRVRSVTKGRRQVAVSWIQSFVLDTAHRDLLFQLKSLQQALEQQQMGAPLYLLSHQIHSNLLRMLTEV